MRFKKILVTAAGSVTLIANQANAGTPGMTAAFTISGIFARDIGFDVEAQTVSNPMGCTLPGAFRVPTSATNRESMVATLLTAFSSGKQISLWVSGCDPDGASTVLGVRIS